MNILLDVRGNRNRRSWIGTIAIGALIVLSAPRLDYAQDFEMKKEVIAGGGEKASTFGGEFTLTGTISQPASGTASDGGFTMCGGFWVPLTEAVIYVDDDAPIDGDGTTWLKAYKYLQDALAVAEEGDVIWVTGGTYYPDQDEGEIVTPGERSETFGLVNGVAIYGGFFGDENPDTFNLADRDFVANETILNGDLMRNDEPVPCTEDSPDCDSHGGLCSGGSCITRLNTGDNSYHVVVSMGVGSTTVLDGVTITAGFFERVFALGGFSSITNTAPGVFYAVPRWSPFL